MPVIFNTMEEFIEMIQDPGKRKVLAAEMARNSDAPSFEGITAEDRAQVMGPIPDVDATPATTIGVAESQANAQAAENNAQGFGGAAGPGIGAIAGGLGQAAQAGQGASPAQVPVPQPRFTGQNLQPNPVQIPNTVGGTSVDSLAKLLARR